MNDVLQEKLESAVNKRKEINKTALSKTPQKVVEIITELIDVLNSECSEIQIEAIEFKSYFTEIFFYAKFEGGWLDIFIKNEKLTSLELQLRLLSYQTKEVEEEIFEILMNSLPQKAYFSKRRGGGFIIDFREG